MNRAFFEHNSPHRLSQFLFCERLHFSLSPSNFTSLKVGRLSWFKRMTVRVTLAIFSRMSLLLFSTLWKSDGKQELPSTSKPWNISSSAIVASAYSWCDYAWLEWKTKRRDIFFIHVAFEFKSVHEKVYWLEPSLFVCFSHVRLWGLSTSQHDPCFSKRSRAEWRTVCLLWSTFLAPAVSWPSVRRDWPQQTLKHICWSCAKALFIKTMWK